VVSLPWRSTVARVSLAAFPLWSTTAVLVLWTPWRQKLAVGSIAALTLVSPMHGLLAVATLAPLGELLEWTLNLNYRLSEAFVLAFLGAWLLRAAGDRRGPRMPTWMAHASWLLAIAALASVCVSGWYVHQYAGPHPDFDFVVWIRQAYYVLPDRFGFVDALRLIEGLGLVAATLYLFRHRPSLALSLPFALALGGAVAAAAAFSVWAGWASPSFIGRFARFGYRAAFINDVNAAGSYFALMVCVALGMTGHGRGRARIAWAALVLANALGLWFTHSKSAAAATAVLVAVAVAWRLSTRWSLAARVGVVSLLLALGIAAASIRAQQLERDPTFQGTGFRSQFNETSMQMIAARPVAGVGVGQYFAASALFLTPEMAFTYGHENAHNYFLETAAELGLPGAILFGAVIVGALAPVAREVLPSPESRLLGFGAGILAMLTTCLSGHPLLVREVAFPFWIALGLATGLAQSAQMNAGAPRRRARLTAPALAAGTVIVLGGAALSAARGPANGLATQPPSATGFYDAERGGDGRPFRWTGQYASLFVPSGVGRISIPIRLGTDLRPIAPIGVSLRINGVDAARTLVGREWTTVEVNMPWPDPPFRFTRIDLQMTRTWQPAIYIAGSADMRQVGVQVGDWTPVP
jgi:O-antigen ligase